MVSSHAVAKSFLGHADSDVTDTYVMPMLEDARAAVNRAAMSIDGGETAQNRAQSEEVTVN